MKITCRVPPLNFWGALASRTHMVYFKSITEHPNWYDLFPFFFSFLFFHDTQQVPFGYQNWHNFTFFPFFFFVIPNEYNGGKEWCKTLWKTKHPQTWTFDFLKSSFYTMQAYLQIHLKIPWMVFHKQVPSYMTPSFLIIVFQLAINNKATCEAISQWPHLLRLETSFSPLRKLLLKATVDLNPRRSPILSQYISTTRSRVHVFSSSIFFED